MPSLGLARGRVKGPRGEKLGVGPIRGREAKTTTCCTTTYGTLHVVPLHLVVRTIAHHRGGSRARYYRTARPRGRVALGRTGAERPVVTRSDRNDCAPYNGWPGNAGCGAATTHVLADPVGPPGGRPGEEIGRGPGLRNCGAQAVSRARWDRSLSSLSRALAPRLSLAEPPSTGTRASSARTSWPYNPRVPRKPTPGCTHFSPLDRRSRMRYDRSEGGIQCVNLI